MKIRKLWISSYKNVDNLEIDFQTELTTLLVGQNGLGKSNLLEALALIFKSLHLINDFDEFCEWPNKKDQFEFIITYTCGGKDITITCKDQNFTITELIGEVDDRYHKFIDFKEYVRFKSDYLPDYVIGYYSGINHRIKEYFSAHQIFRTKNIRAKEKVDYALGKLFFTEQNLGELLFFTLWVFKSSPNYANKISRLFSEFLKIDRNSKILIGFNNPKYFVKNKIFENRSAENILANLLAKEKIEYPFWGLDGKIDSFLQALWENNSQEPITFDDESYDSDKDKISFISYNDLNFDSFYKNLEERGIETPLQLFDVLLQASDLDIIYAINSVLNKNGGTINHSYKELSEGEQQLLTVMGLVLITSEYETLYLLDEPDTHLNPKWQRDYVQLLNDFNLNDYTSHIFVATHSPLLVQSIKDQDDHQFDIILYSKNEKGEIDIENRPDIIENWRIDQVLASKYFDIKNTRPVTLDNFMTAREELLTKPNLTKEDLDKLKDWETKSGLLPSGETLNDFNAMHLVRTIAKEIKENDQN